MGVLTTEVTTSVTNIGTCGIPAYPITVKNQGPATVFLDLQVGEDSSSVTANQESDGGYPLEPSESWTNPAYLEGPSYAATYYTLYAITAEGIAYVTIIG